MEVIARVELGMTSEQFYACAWYDWTLWLEKVHNDRKKRREDQELIMEMFRSSLSYYFNWNKGKNTPELKREAFWPLSYDQVMENDNTELSEEDKEDLAQRIKFLESKSKRKKRG